MHAPEKKDGGKGKKKRKGTSEDLSRGGVDGGLRFLAILPFPVESAYDGGGGIDELFVIVHTYEDHMLNPFVNVLQTSRADGAKLSRPLLSNWSFPVRSVADGRRLKVCQATKEFVHNMDFWFFEDGPLENMPLFHYHSLCRHMMFKFMSDGVKVLEGGGGGAGGGKSPTGRHWHLAKVGHGTSSSADASFESMGPEMDRGVYVTVHVQDILVDEDISPSLVKGLRDSGRAEVLPRLYHAVLPTLIAVDDVEGLRLKSKALVDDEGGDRGGFAHLKKPVGQSSGAMLSYNGPIRGVGNIVESVPVAAVQERGGGVANQPLGSVSPSAANAFGEVEGNDSGYANGKPSATATAVSLVGLDEETRRVLAKAGLGRMPATTFEWVKFERVQQGLPADPPCPVCQKPNAQKRCTRCKIVRYCSRECQKQHWPTHKLECYADS
ncbi:MYND finger protein, putative [Ectocarpus siliculosus]|uniref:MYND finger protein, putative n=1 Tax=Ectocarpus siliculosus TaxID=2880 RepID=D7FVP0_ECTSI|nr:MYND finger protein, putative [Ectocarpus siliculosus]|eukprot:CBJ31961.1 MYND finger protein, putative [Ectocarpus siliculosus]